MAKWSKPPAELQKQIVLELRQCVQISYFLFLQRLVTRTPRLTGQLQNNWQTALNVPAVGIIPGGSEGAQASYASAKSALDNYVLGETITLRNNLPYARRIEYDGWSRVKAPEGMLRITAAEWPQFVSQGIKAVKAGASNATE